MGVKHFGHLTFKAWAREPSCDLPPFCASSLARLLALQSGQQTCQSHCMRPASGRRGDVLGLLCLESASLRSPSPISKVSQLSILRRQPVRLTILIELNE
jgi:hypothetical protein